MRTASEFTRGRCVRLSESTVATPTLRMPDVLFSVVPQQMDTIGLPTVTTIVSGFQPGALTITDAVPTLFPDVVKYV